jgi:hypothetical protein
VVNLFWLDGNYGKGARVFEELSENVVACKGYVFDGRHVMGRVYYLGWHQLQWLEK